MARKGNSPIGVGMTAKQMKRKKPINTDLLTKIEPITDNQKVLFDSYKEGKNIFAYGAAGTGKTFVALYLALRDVLDQYTPYDKVYVVRSLVSTREIGFLPGDHEDKSSLYQIPYKHMVKYMFEMATDADFEMLYGNLKMQETIKFWSTSFIRGTTIDKASFWLMSVRTSTSMNSTPSSHVVVRIVRSSSVVTQLRQTCRRLMKRMASWTS